MLSGQVPPFIMVATAFAVAFGIGLIYLWLRGISVKSLVRQPINIWAIGIGGLFGYHFLYFLAFRLAPAVEVNLLNYLWPLLIVLFSALLPGERLQWWHIVGAILGFVGAFVLLTGGDGFTIEEGYLTGYAAAIGAAVIWASYSVLSRRFSEVPTEMVALYCGATSVLALLCHLIFEEMVRPYGTQWLILIVMGLGPVGSAFYLWDYGVKRGNIRLLGVAAYLIPLLSTALLVLFGGAEAGWRIWVACGLIVSGALLAGRNLLLDRN
ncbi:MAG: EamA family transporter [Anaerolineales bacterium]|nr:EamA family transporter [Anaerolineales bacterium]